MLNINQRQKIIINNNISIARVVNILLATVKGFNFTVTAAVAFA